MSRTSGSSSTISTLPGVVAMRSGAIKSCTASSVRETGRQPAAAGAAVSGFDATPVEPTSGGNRDRKGSGSGLPTRRPRRSRDLHDRDRRQDDREQREE